MPKSLLDQLHEQPANEQMKDMSSAFKLKMIDEVYSTENITVKTRLNMRQVIALSRGEIFARLYKSETMANLCQTIKEHLVSLDGKGRVEFVDIAKSLIAPEPEHLPTLKSRLLGE